MTDEEEKFRLELIDLKRYMLTILLIALVFELGLMVFAYVNADEVECNLLWCTFTSTDQLNVSRGYELNENNTVISSTCSINGHKVNCSEVDDYIGYYEIWGYKE